MLLHYPRTDTRQALELIEQAGQRQPVCPCGAHTVAVAHPGQVRLECVSLSRPRSPLRRLLTLDWPVLHTDRPIVDLETLEAA